ncbi:meiosis initiator protein-like [Xyrauchen texanus]|uniref:meiosis initiator protein-like n=1 Tax=Xyrauchen texanus TaxID=154827 RepID=UPI00224254EA|nr:meiosis initiator protein-like [Xyrauchen texanus]
MPLHPPLNEEHLNISPSLLTSPSQGLSHSLLPEGQEALQTLFKDVWITPESIILKSPSLPCSLANDSVGHKTLMRVSNGGYLSSESEEENKGSEEETSTPEQLIPLKRARPHRHTAQRGRVKTQPRPKKKCVNGFIMFCRINRKLYIRSHPGISSTTVTKELAHLWRIMPKMERRVYTLKAWLFSRQQNRNVRAELHEGEINAKDCISSPLYMLLAHRDHGSLTPYLATEKICLIHVISNSVSNSHQCPRTTN